MPPIDVDLARTPRLFRNVSRNLLLRMQDDRHGVHRLGPIEAEGDKFNELGGIDSDDVTHNELDCKETPGSGCNSAKRLRMIREGKQVIVDDEEERSPTRDHDSRGWYNFCSDDGGCMHEGESERDIIAGRDMVIIHVWVPRPQLGLSPRSGSRPGLENMLYGDVIREFEHFITHAKMYKVQFGGGLGMRVVAKEYCEPTAEEELNDPSVKGIQRQNGSHVQQESTFTLDFPSYFGTPEDSSDEKASDADWEAEFVDWRGNSNSGNSDWVISDSGSDPEIVEDSNPSQPDIEFESLDFEH